MLSRLSGVALVDEEVPELGRLGGEGVEDDEEDGVCELCGLVALVADRADSASPLSRRHARRELFDPNSSNRRENRSRSGPFSASVSLLVVPSQERERESTNRPFILHFPGLSSCRGTASSPLDGWRRTEVAATP